MSKGEQVSSSDDPIKGFASPPCFMHELDPAYGGLARIDDQTAIDVARWRKGERKRLIDERLAVPAKLRARAAERIADRLTHETRNIQNPVIGVYWPFRGEPDLRDWGRHTLAQGARLALPVVVEKRMPLVFRIWASGDRLEKGVWNIPIPSGGEEVVPDIVVAPLVGYDAAGFRLGYGGGFYDRTLASFPSKPLTIGVGFEFARLETIFPQWYDVPMDRLVVESVQS